MTTLTNPIILSPHDKNVTLTGTIHAYGSVGVYSEYPHSYYDAVYGAVGAAAGPRFTILNLGDIDSAGDDSGKGGGIVLGSAGTITNHGTITGKRAIDILGTINGAEIINTGTLVARHQFAPQTGVYGIYLQSRGSVANSGVITGGEAGIDLHGGGTAANTGHIQDTYLGILAGGPATLTNRGAITGHIAGVDLLGGSLINSAAGRITEGYGKYKQAPSVYAGVRMESGEITNNGAIKGANGIIFDARGNQATLNNSGLISAWGTADSKRTTEFGFLADGVGVRSSEAETLDNAGTIQATHAGIVLETSPLYGTFLNAATILNTGLIKSSKGYGLYLVGDGITVNNSGTIAGHGRGIVTRALSSFASDITNTGLITAPAFTQFRDRHGGGTIAIPSAAILVTGAGTIDNTEGATITAAHGAGIQVNTARTNIYTHRTTILHATILNAGLIQAQHGIELSGDGYIANTGTITATGIGVKTTGSLTAVYNYGLITSPSIAISIARGAYLYNAGTIIGGIDAAGPITNNGLIDATTPLTITATIRGAGTIDLPTSATIEAGIGPHQTLAFTAPAETLTLTRPGAFAGTIANFQPGDTIDLADIPRAAILSETFAAGTLILATTAATYRYALAGNFNNETISLFTDGTGTGINLAAPMNPSLREAKILPKRNESHYFRPRNQRGDKMTTIGSSSSTVTLSTASPVVTITGPVDAFGTVGTFLSNGTLTPFEAAIFGADTTHFTVFNTGLVESVGTTKEDTGILLTAAGTVDNTGTIIAGTGVNIFGSTASDLLVNSKFIEGTIGSAVVINGVATLNNAGTLLSTQGDGAYIHFGGIATNTGTIIGYREGIEAAYGPATIINQGKIIATATSFVNHGTTDISHGIILRQGGAVTNSAAGTIIGETGIAVLGTTGGHVVNDGHVTATGHSGIYLFSKGVIENAKTGLIQSARASMELYGGGTANNYGTIDSDRSGIYLRAGGTVHNTGAITAGTSGIYDFSATAIADNETSGRITAADSGIDLKSGGQAYNAGFISGTLSGIYMDGSGSVTNAKSGTIDSATLGIALEAGGTVDNAGLIDSAGTGISIINGDATNTGTILSTGIARGIYIGGSGVVAAYNGKTGFISAAAGIDLAAKGNVTNNGAMEVTLGNAVFLGAGGTITNGGLITASDPFIGGGDGIALVGGGRIVNTGTIYGANNAIQVTQGGTIVDSGTLIGGRDAIYFGVFGSTSNLLILSPTAHTTGTVFGGGGRLELEADGTKIGTAAPAQFVDFASVTIESKAIWDMAGTFLTSLGLTLVNDGTIKESATDLITISGAIEGTGLIDLSKQAFTLEGSIAASQTIAFTGTAETLGLANPQDFHAKIEHFSIGDTIELEGVPKTSIATTHFAGGVLTLTGDGHTVDITFASPASFGTDVFVLTAEGANTALTLKKPAMTILSPTTPPDSTTLPSESLTPGTTMAATADSLTALTMSLPTPIGIAAHLLHPTPTTLPAITLQP